MSRVEQKRSRIWITAVIACLSAGCGESGSATTPSVTGAGGKRSADSSGSQSNAGGSESSAGGGDLSSLSGTVTIDGSSTVYLISERAAEEFQKATKGNVKVTLGIVGTGGGFKKFVRGEIDIADASRPILQKEIAEARTNNIEYIELPIALDALTVVVHRDNKLESIKLSELKKMWEPAAEGKITKWNQVNPEWPDAPLKLYGPGPSSGTFDYFTEVVVGTAKKSRPDYGANEDDNVIVSQIAGNKNALGYFGYAYYYENRVKLKALPVDDETGRDEREWMPNETNAKDGKYCLARPLFIYVNKKAAERPEVKACVEFYLQRAAEFAKDVKYIGLDSDVYEMARNRFKELQVGTAFGGVHARVSKEDLLNKEVVQ